MEFNDYHRRWKGHYVLYMFQHVAKEQFIVLLFHHAAKEQHPGFQRGPPP